LLRDFRHGGPKAIERVRRLQPASYLKICALMVPREMKVEQTNVLASMSDDELREGIAAIEEYLARKRAGELAAPIEGQVVAETFPPKRKRPNRLMMEADTAVGPKERSPRKRLLSAL
jgi:hypothetical protein